MRTKFFIFAMLAGMAASAQSHINIEMISATYTASSAVKFRISWNSIPTITGQTHNAKIWVWVDFLKINADNTTSGNTWTRAEISATPAVSSSPTSTAALDASTNKGFWLNGVTGSYSATVTATLSNIPANTKFNWCVYTSDCPPNVTANNGTYTFKGTPPFTLTASGGATQTVTGTTLAATALIITPSTIRDKTECPGIFCPYQGSDLYIDATHFCQQRTSGAKNWEAWIKDTRDNELYRIVLMPDNYWWLAQNVKLAKYQGKTAGSSLTVCDKDECGRGYSSAEAIGSWGGSSGKGNVQGICPPSWVLPLNSDWINLIKAIQPSVTFISYSNTSVSGQYINNTNIATQLNAVTNECHTGNDYFGWASKKKWVSDRSGIEGWWCGTGAFTRHYNHVNHQPGTYNDCNYVAASACQESNTIATTLGVRCFRQL